MTVDAPHGRTAAGRVTAEGVEQRFVDGAREVVALDGIDLAIEPGELVSLVGPSGCGKTTLLQLIAGFQFPTAGTVRVDGKMVDGPSPDRGVVFQVPNLFPWLTVRGNIEFGPRMRKVAKAERRQRSSRLLDLVGLADFGDSRTYQLSGGMQQRAQLARVLANDPRILLMDEPFGALDTMTRHRLQGELRGLHRTTGKTVVFVTHSVEEAVFLGTRVVAMSARPGRVVFDAVTPYADRADLPDAARAEPEFVDLRREVLGVIHGQAPA